MKPSYVRRAVYIIVPAVIVMAAYLLTGILGSSDNQDGLFALSPPSFVQVAQADSDAVSAFPTNEAGIAAYFQSSSTIDLDNIRPIYRTIEVETTDYIIGSVPVPNYSSETEDVHVYAHVDGWVMAYYLADDPAAKIFDWSVYDGVTIITKFDTVLTLAASALTISLPTTTYYDFRYPNATNLVLIADAVYEGSGNPVTDSFEVNMPNNFTYFERSWAINCYEPAAGRDARYRLNGIEIYYYSTCPYSGNWADVYDTFTPLQLPANTTHTIEIERHIFLDHVFGGLALVYQVP